MARGRRRPARRQTVRLGDLGDTQQTRSVADEYVDPLDAEPGEAGLHDDGDPFGRDTMFEDDDEPDEAGDGDVEEPEGDADADEEADEGEPAADEEAPADAGEHPDLAALRVALAEERRLREDLERERQTERERATEERTKRIDDDLAAAEAALEAAIDNGETKTQVELHRKLARLEAEKRQLHQPAPQQRQQEAGGQMVRLTGPALEWGKGKGWINDPHQADANRLLLTVAKNLADEGYNPDEPGFYAEVDARMQKRRPDLYPTEKAKPKPPRRVTPVSRDDPPKAPVTAKSIRLSPAQLENMRRFGLDPANKQHLRQYAKSVIENSQPR